MDGPAREVCLVATITVRDETFPGREKAELTLEFLTERVTVWELIRGRVYQEVTEHNAKRALAPAARPLVEPTATERLLNGTAEAAPPKRVDWQQQFDRALKAFHRNGFLVMVNGQQYDLLDAEIELSTDTQITFLRLVPLVGG
jgi:hypothetical protein